jgi:hydroxyacylglutathione hydrolase
MRAIEKVYAGTVIFGVTRELYYGQLRATPPQLLSLVPARIAGVKPPVWTMRIRIPFPVYLSTNRHHSAILPLALLLLGASAAPGVDVGHAAFRSGMLPTSWITGGPKCMEVPDWQVHEYNPDFYILRESGCTHFEKPFLYLLFGADKVLLVDTGSGNNDAARAVSGVIGKWLRRNRRESIPLVVAHSHSHDDHRAGDAGFASLAGTTMVPLTVAGTQQFFGIKNWPVDAGAIDLGGRVIDVIPIPGHDQLSVALYDRQTGVLLTGDSLYPGRLYIPDFAAFKSSTERLVAFTNGKLITHILGCHIEQSRTPYVDYPIGSLYQPEEHSLELARAHLLELNEALHGMQSSPTSMALRDFTIYPTDDDVWKVLEALEKKTQEEQIRCMWDQAACR